MQAPSSLVDATIAALAAEAVLARTKRRSRGFAVKILRRRPTKETARAKQAEVAATRPRSALARWFEREEDARWDESQRSARSRDRGSPDSSRGRCLRERGQDTGGLTFNEVDDDCFGITDAVSVSLA